MRRLLHRRVLAICTALALTTGCALLPFGRYAAPMDPTSSASAEEEEAGNAIGDPGASSAEPGGGEPRASNPQAIPDPLHPLTAHAGEPVDVGSATISYLGLEKAGDQVRAVFRIESGSLASARLIAPSHEIVDVHASGGELWSDPFGSASAPPFKSSHLTLVVGERLYIFDMGPVT